VAVGLCDFVLLVTLSLSLDTCTPLWTKSLIIRRRVAWSVLFTRPERAIMYIHGACAVRFSSFCHESVVGLQCFLYCSVLILTDFQVRVLQSIWWDESNECLIGEGVRLCLFECVVDVLSKTPVRTTGLGGRELNLEYDTLTREPAPRVIVFPFPASSRDFYLLKSIQDGFGSHPASYSMCVGDSSPTGKAAEG